MSPKIQLTLASWFSFQKSSWKWLESCKKKLFPFYFCKYLTSKAIIVFSFDVKKNSSKHSFPFWWTFLNALIECWLKRKKFDLTKFFENTTSKNHHRFIFKKLVKSYFSFLVNLFECWPKSQIYDLMGLFENTSKDCHHFHFLRRKNYFGKPKTSWEKLDDFFFWYNIRNEAVIIDQKWLDLDWLGLPITDWFRVPEINSKIT